jgi:hypothetical protein
MKHKRVPMEQWRVTMELMRVTVPMEQWRVTMELMRVTMEQGGG